MRSIVNSQKSCILNPNIGQENPDPAEIADRRAVGIDSMIIFRTFVNVIINEITPQMKTIPKASRQCSPIQIQQ